MPFPTQFPVAVHTDHVSPGGIFVAIKGTQDDGTKYIPLAIERGARTIVIDQETQLSDSVQDIIYNAGACISRVPNTRKALAELSAQAAGYPANQLKIIGITGTKGKTTTAFMTYHILHKAGYKTALISSVKNCIDGIEYPSNLIPPQPDYLHQFLALCVTAGITHVVMEIAAHAITLHRIDGIFFDGVVFTNFGLEHLEFYGSMDDYFKAKCELLNRRKPAARALINADNEWTAQLIGQYAHSVSFGCNHTSDIHALNIKDEHTQQTFVCNGYEVALPLIGLCNIYNALAAIGLAQSIGVALRNCTHALSSFSGVPGRCESYPLPNGALCIIDYAHNPMSYQAILEPLRQRTPHLTVIFGAGGQRDASRRPLMGAIAAQYADTIILTTDNPRTEDPSQIIQDILSGIDAPFAHKVIKELDREKAIRTAYQLSKKDSIIVLLGKGRDEYQIIGTKKYPFSEADIIKSL